MGVRQRTKRELLLEVEELRARLAKAGTSCGTVAQDLNTIPKISARGIECPPALAQAALPDSLPEDRLTHAIVFCDSSGCIIQANPAASALCNADPTSQPFDSVFPFQHQSENAGMDPHVTDMNSFSISKVLCGDVFREAEVALQGQNGEVRDFLMSAWPLSGREGGLLGCVVVLCDRTDSGVMEEALRLESGEFGEGFPERIADLIKTNEILRREVAERKQIEEALSHSEERFRAIFESAAVGMALIDLHGRILARNPALLGLFGGDESDLPSGFWEPGSVSDGRAGNSDSFSELVQGKLEQCQKEKRYMLKDGRLMWCQLTVSLIRDAAGKPHSAVVMVLDITENKKAEKALRQSEARYRAIVDDQVELVSRIRPDFRVSFVNEAYCRCFEATREELIGSSLWDHIPLKGQERLRQHYASLTRENPVALFQHRIMLPDGQVAWQQWTDRGIFDERGRLKEIQSVGRDITKQKEAEEAMQETEKQLRFLSSQLLEVQEKERKRIARELHDSVGQYLSAIKYGLENLMQAPGIEQVGAVSKSLETLVPLVRNAIEEVRRIYMDLRPSLLDDLGIIPTIDWFCREFSTIYSGIAIEKEVGIEERDVPEPLKIIVFRIVQEALNNIARHSEANLVRLCLKKTLGGMELAIRDDGRGFNRNEVLPKGDLQGGVGLVSMKERAELSGGTFALESVEGKGTLIRVVWPTSPSDQAEEDEPAAAERKGQPVAAGA